MRNEERPKSKGVMGSQADAYEIIVISANELLFSAMPVFTHDNSKIIKSLVNLKKLPKSVTNLGKL